MAEFPVPDTPSDEPTPDDAGLGKDAARGAQPQQFDLAHVAALYIEHSLELRRFLRGVLRSPEAAEDALQSTFAKAIEVKHTINPTSAKGWLFRVAMNQALATRRRQKVHERAVEHSAGEERSPKRQVERDSPAGGLIRWETVELVRRAIGLLPEVQQQVVRMRIDQGKTFALIAEELKLPLGTVLSRMQAALKRLRTDLDELDTKSN